MDKIQSFFSMLDGKFTAAIVFMLIIVVVTCYISFVLLTSIKKRNVAVKVKLPDLNQQGVINTSNNQFENKEVTVELINPADDVIGEYNNNNDKNSNDKSFLEALSVSTGSYIPEDEKSIKVDLPEVGEFDYEELKKQKEKELEKAKIAREQANLEHLKELAQADNNSDIVSEK